jgi:putative ABC transport system substrate-binding protein
MLRKVLILLLAVIGGAVVWKHRERTGSAHDFKVSICKVTEHEAIDSVVKGIQDFLRKHSDIKLTVDTCQGNRATAAQIISKFVDSNSDVVVTVGTMPTQVAFKLAEDGTIKLVFASITDPDSVSPNLVNTTGVSNFVDIRSQIELFKRIQPDLKKLGIIYDTGEINSVIIVKHVKEAVEELGIELVEVGIQRSSDILQAAKSIVRDVDAVFISNDNMVLAGISYVIRTFKNARKPVYVSDTDQVPKGCLAALGPDQYGIGLQAGRMIERIKNREDINRIPVEYPVPHSIETHVNSVIARELGIVIPEKILQGVSTVVR